MNYLSFILSISLFLFAVLSISAAMAHPINVETLSEALADAHPPAYTGFWEIVPESINVNDQTFRFEAKQMQGGFAGNVDKKIRANFSGHVDASGKFHFEKEEDRHI